MKTKRWVRISAFPLLDILRFKNLPARRDRLIGKAQEKTIQSEFLINEKAKRLHPASQEMVVDHLVRHGDQDAVTFFLRRKDGTNPAFFKAGQYVSLFLELDGSFVSRPYSLSSSPLLAKTGLIAITVKEVKGGFVSTHLLSHVKEGSPLLVSGPQGQFTYEKLRDGRHVVGLAGGSGITPFLSLACAIRDGLEDFRLTILYGSRNEKAILFQKELAEIAASTDKVKVVHVLSEEEKDGFEKGYLTASLIERYLEGEDSLFLCGPEAMYRFLDEELGKLHLPSRRIRRELFGASELQEERSYRVVIHQGDKSYESSAHGNESVLVAIERAGVKAPSRCRSGECGWCRSHLLSGTVCSPKEKEHRRYADKGNGEIHPCVSYPTSDLEIEVPGFCT